MTGDGIKEVKLPKRKNPCQKQENSRQKGGQQKSLACHALPQLTLK